MEKLAQGAQRLGIALSQQELILFQTFYEEIIDWNQRINLTSITDYTKVQTDHFLDALTVTLAWKPGDGPASVIDVGAGPGVPGIPLKIAFPQLHLTLLEATAKKAAFLRHVVEKLGLKDVNVVTGRAEDVAHDDKYRGLYDVVLCRAVAAMAALVELTLPFCKIGGIVIAHKRGDIKKELASAEKAIKTLGGRLREVKPVNLPEFADNRVLVIVEKIMVTPGQYPRRAGLPAKKPIT